MLTLQQADCGVIAYTPNRDESIDGLLSKEWLLTNGLGGYASSTVAGCNTRAYHGLLIGSLNPPTNRVMALSNCLEMIVRNGDVFNLSTFDFGDKFAPAGYPHIKRFSRDAGVHFEYTLDCAELTKSVYLLRNSNTAALVYDFVAVTEPFEFILRPFFGLRDFHSLQKSYAGLCSRQQDGGVLVRHHISGNSELFLSCPEMAFETDKQWWFGFSYRRDMERGQACTEDLWTPGFFKQRIDRPARIVLWANLSARHNPLHLPEMDIEAVLAGLQSRRDNLAGVSGTNGSSELRSLLLAADQFVAEREGVQSRRFTILAGYPWFADWGRDSFIALPGLLLATKRFDEAKSVLTTFAGAADEGMIPNRFDDRSHTAHFNSVDASLWFINAAFQYFQATGDSKTFMQDLLPIIRWIIDSYEKGTRYGVRADVDGLITAGSENTQLTWMDAKFDGVAFTPRHGKPVEVNSLWYNALRLLARFYSKRNPENSRHYRSMAEKVRAGFCELFWDESRGYLSDCIHPDGTADASIRPNQIFAVSLPFSPLSARRQRAVVDVVRKELLTPYGLRTLSARDSRYKGLYTGGPQQRDEAYHQGTVWPYLIGPFVESFLKVNDFSRKSKKAAAEFIQPLLRHLTETGCIGSISEIFDGDPPHRPKGCIAQAWSVAELIRAYQLINS